MQTLPERTAGAPARHGLLSIESESVGGCYRMRVAGELDRSNADLLTACITHAEASPEPEIVVDLSRLTFIDSSGLRILIAAAERSEPASDRLSIVAPTRVVRRILDLTGTEAYLPLAR
jgi:anti-anti-sigma factor